MLLMLVAASSWLLLATCGPLAAAANTTSDTAASALPSTEEVLKAVDSIGLDSNYTISELVSLVSEKIARDNGVPVSSRRLMSTAPVLVMCGVDLHLTYDDLSSKASSSPDMCALLCLSSIQDCNAVTWTDHNGGTCWFKTVGAYSYWYDAVPKTGAVSFFQLNRNVVEGLRARTFFNVDMPGGDMSSQSKLRDPSYCQNHCHKKPDCFASSWTDHDGGTCWFKRKASTLVPKQGTFSTQHYRVATVGLSAHHNSRRWPSTPCTLHLEQTGEMMQHLPPAPVDSGVRKKRRMTVIEGESLYPLAAPSSAELALGTGTHAATATTITTTRRLSYQDAARELARRRWRLLQKHVCIMQWLSKDLMRRQLKRFALAQESLVDVLITSKDDFMEVFVKIREQFLSLLDAENCILSFEANRSILEFDGRSIYPSTRAKRGLLRTAMANGEPVHLCPQTASGISGGGAGRMPGLEGVPHSIGEIRSYVCLPLVDSEGTVQAVAEVFNSRHDAKIVASWLRAGDNGSLHVLRNFVGNLIKAFTKRANIGDLVSGASASMTRRASTEDDDAPSSSSSSSSEINEYPLESLVDFLRHSVGIEHCSVFAYDKDVELLWARLSDCCSCPQTVKCDDGIIGMAARAGQKIHYTRNPQSHEFKELFSNIRLQSDDVHEALSIPTLNAHQKLNGVVLLLNKKDRSAFTEADIAMCTNLCRHIGNALHSSELHEAILKAQGKAQTLLDLSAVLFRELETNALLIAIMDAIKKPMNASKCCVFLMDDDKNELIAPVGSDIAHDTSQRTFRIPVSEGIVGAAARQGEIINVRDAYGDTRFNPMIDKQTGFVTRSILAIPIKDADGDVLGVLEMVNKLSKQYFDKDDEELARGIAYYLAIALKNAKLFESARSAMRRSDALLAMMQVISSSNENVGDVFRALVDTACQILNVEHGALFFVDALSKSLFCRVGANWKGYTIPLGKFIPGIVAERGEAITLSRQARSHPDFDVGYDELVGIRSKSLLCVPIKSSSSASVIAVFYAVNKLGSSSSGGGSGSSGGSQGNGSSSGGSGHGGSGTFCEEDSKIMNAICAEMSSIVERRAWELVFLVESSSETSGGDTTQVMSSFLSQYTTTPTLPRRRSSLFGSRAPTPINATNTSASAISSSGSSSSDDMAAMAMASATGISGGLLSKVFASGSITSNKMTRCVGEPPLIRDWDLNPWEYSAPQLVDLVLDMFDYFDLPHRYQIERATMRRFVVGVKGQYQEIPYHNFYHAFTTLHVSFLIVSSQSSIESAIASVCRAAHEASSPHSRTARANTSTGSSTSACASCDATGGDGAGDGDAVTTTTTAPRSLLEVRDILSVFVAAFCHDMNHNGRTNDFHIRYRTSLAMLYNDQSVLENMHAAACFETMRRPGHDILEHVNANEYRQMRKSIIRAILATDMHNHAGIVSHLHEKLKVDVFNPDDETHKELLMNAIVHSADISGPALTQKIHVKWSLQLLEEFNMQYNEETALGMAPTPYMNAKPDSPELGKLNLAFIDSCVFPLWSIMNTFLEGLDTSLANIQSNRGVWIQMISDAEAASASAAAMTDAQQVEAMEQEDEEDDDL